MQQGREQSLRSHPRSAGGVFRGRLLSLHLLLSGAACVRSIFAGIAGGRDSVHRIGGMFLDLFHLSASQLYPRILRLLPYFRNHHSRSVRCSGLASEDTIHQHDPGRGKTDSGISVWVT